MTNTNTRGLSLKRSLLCGCVFQTQLKVDVSNLKEDISKLKSQIVESPEELKTQMEKMRENVKNIKTSIVSDLPKLLFEDKYMQLFLFI